MLIEGTIIRDCVTRNLPNSLGAPIDKLHAGDKIRINGVERRPEGTWYYVGASGWLKARDFEIDRDIEFLVKAKKMKLLDMQQFSLVSPGGLTSITDNSLSVGQVTGIAITDKGGCFGQPGSSISGLGSIGGITGETKIGSIASSFGIDVGGGVLGKTLKDSTLDSLFDGSILENLLDNAIDALFGSFFSRLRFVVGFDIEALLGKLYGAWDMGSFEDVLEAIEKTGLAGIWNGTFFGELANPITWFGKTWDTDNVGSNFWTGSFTSSYIASVNYFNYLGCANGQVVRNNAVGKAMFENKDEFGRTIGMKSLSYDSFREQAGAYYYTDAQNLDFSTPLLNNDNREEVDYSTPLLTSEERENIDYSTPILNSQQIPEEVKFNTDLFENIYTDFKESIDKVKTNLDLNIERIEWFVNFNRYRKTHPEYHLVGSQGHVFMTRPALNLFEGNSTSEVSKGIASSSDAAFFAEAIKRHSIIAKSLTPSLSGNHDFIPIIHNTARSIDIQDTSIDTKEHGETLTKWKIMYAKDAIKSLTSGTFSISYIDDSQLSISFLHLIWLYYMNGVSRGEYGPVDQCIKDGILDYAASCYYILTDMTGEDIIFWSKYWGVFPTNYPSSSFSLKDSDMVKTPEISIQYAYSFKRDMDPLILAEFNRNSQAGKDFTYIPIHLHGADAPYGTMVGSPFIEYYTRQNDGSASYKLRFRKPPENDTGGEFSLLGKTNWLQTGMTVASSFI